MVFKLAQVSGHPWPMGSLVSEPEFYRKRLVDSQDTVASCLIGVLCNQPGGNNAAPRSRSRSRSFGSKAVPSRLPASGRMW